MFYRKYHQWLKWRRVANSQPDPLPSSVVPNAGEGLSRFTVGKECSRQMCKTMVKRKLKNLFGLI